MPVAEQGVMSAAAGFLGGARDRLLPASLIFRFFIAAALFQVAAWAMLFAAAENVAGYVGGPGPVLAAIHLATLGVFVSAAMGASYQLLPVVTRRPIARHWPVRLSFWLMMPGIAALAWGMATGEVVAMTIGTVPILAGLALYGALTAHNLGRAGGVAVVAAHGWGALAALAAFASIGAVLVRDFAGGFLADHAGLARLHMQLAAFGFMGLLVIGLSLILIPMLALSHSPDPRAGQTQLILGVAALAAAAAVWAAPGDRFWSLAALALAGAAAAVHIRTMTVVLRRRMRKRLGLSFVMIRASWGLLVLALGLAAAIRAGVAPLNAPALFGFILLAGWLLTFLMGVLQRIMPFLASMHASNRAGLPLLPSELGAQVPLSLHAACHGTALVAVSAGIALDIAPLVAAGAGAGILGALAFALFAVRLVMRLRA